MRPSSCKAKGRRFQQQVRDDLRAIGAKYGLEPDDTESRGMGQAGDDIVFSPAAKRLFNLCIECKNVENLNTIKVFWDHYVKYEDTTALKLLIHKRNRTEPLVTLRWEDLLRFIEERINVNRSGL